MYQLPRQATLIAHDLFDLVFSRSWTFILFGVLTGCIEIFQSRVLQRTQPHSHWTEQLLGGFVSLDAILLMAFTILGVLLISGALRPVSIQPRVESFVQPLYALFRQAIGANTAFLLGLAAIALIAHLAFDRPGKALGSAVLALVLCVMLLTTMTIINLVGYAKPSTMSHRILFAIGGLICVALPFFMPSVAPSSC